MFQALLGSHGPPFHSSWAFRESTFSRGSVLAGLLADSSDPLHHLLTRYMADPTGIVLPFHVSMPLSQFIPNCLHTKRCQRKGSTRQCLIMSRLTCGHLVVFLGVSENLKNYSGTVGQTFKLTHSYHRIKKHLNFTV